MSVRVRVWPCVCEHDQGWYILHPSSGIVSLSPRWAVPHTIAVRLAILIAGDAIIVALVAVIGVIVVAAMLGIECTQWILSVNWRTAVLSMASMRRLGGLRATHLALRGAAAPAAPHAHGLPPATPAAGDAVGAGAAAPPHQATDVGAGAGTTNTGTDTTGANGAGAASARSDGGGGSGVAMDGDGDGPLDLGPIPHVVYHPPVAPAAAPMPPAVPAPVAAPAPGAAPAVEAPAVEAPVGALAPRVLVAAVRTLTALVCWAVQKCFLHILLWPLQLQCLGWLVDFACAPLFGVPFSDRVGHLWEGA